MGSKKYRIAIFYLSVFIFASCFSNRKIIISSGIFSKDSFIITLKTLNFKIKQIGNIELQCNNSTERLVFEREDIKLDVSNNEVNIYVDYTDKKIHIGSDYELIIRFSGGYIKAFIYFEYKNSKNSDLYIYPCEYYEEINMIIKDSYCIIGK